MANCAGCRRSGTEGPEFYPGDNPIDVLNSYMDNISSEEIAEIKPPLLFHVAGQYYCYPCRCVIHNECFQCGDSTTTLYRDKRCKNNPYVCAECVDSHTVNHLYACYSDGCMTPGELAQEEWEILLSESGQFD